MHHINSVHNPTPHPYRMYFSSILPHSTMSLRRCIPFKVFHQNLLFIYVKWFRYRPGVAQRVGRGIALLFHDRSTRTEWVVSSIPRPQFTPGKDPVSILQEVGWAPGPVWTGGKSRPHRDSIPNRRARSSVAIPTELPGPPFRKIARLYLENRMIRKYIPGL